MSRFRHGPLEGQAECDEWIATTLRKLPTGALARLYRILNYNGLRMDSVERLEREWRKISPKI